MNSPDPFRPLPSSEAEKVHTIGTSRDSVRPAKRGTGIGFSVLILTLNADRDLPDCLASVAACHDVVVLDCGSTDRTTELARAAGARVFVHAFETFAGQRNHAQREIPFRHPWVFHLDADERMTAELAFECDGARQEQNVDGFLVAPKVLWDGKWIPRASGFPALEARFVCAPEFEFVAAGHTQRESPRMRMGRLHSCYLHDPSRGGEDEWLARARGHARIAARDPLARAAVFNHRLPGRRLARFLQRYILGRGFLDGREGLHYCWLLGRSASFQADELRRARDRRKTSPPHL